MFSKIESTLSENKNIIISLGIGLVSGYLLTKLWAKANEKQKRRKTLLDYVGNTPMIYLPKLSKALGCEIYCKVQYMNPFGSSKDRAVKKMLEEGLKSGKIKQQTEVVEASSGSTAITLVQTCKIMGLNPVLFLTNDLAEDKYIYLQTLGAKIIKVPPVSIVDQEHFVNKAKSYAQSKSAFLLNQFENLHNAGVHEQTTGKQIYESLGGQINAFICSAGTGGTIAGVSKYLKNKNNHIKIILSDPQGSGLHNKIKYGTLFTTQQRQGTRLKNPFDTVIEGVGLNRPTKNFQEAQIDDSQKVKDIEALHMAYYLIQNEGIFVGGSSAVNLSAAVKYGRKNPKSRIVTILHDSGNRYLKKIYSQEYRESKNVFFQRRQRYESENLDFIQ